MEYSFSSLFPGARPHNLSAILQQATFQDGWLKCRIEYDASDYDLSVLPYEKATFNHIVFQEIGSFTYPFKFADRAWINNFEKEVPDKTALLFLKEGKVTDGAYFNVAFKNGDEWLTPYQPLLKGTCRERLIQNGTLQTAVIKKADLHWFSAVRLFNAMTGWEQAWELSMENAIFKG
ncbi:MAG: aminotransferase class IV [Saprospiraceae bacterium]|nr:aminotransferase class IV [Saprospiraceae bacterium]